MTDVKIFSCKQCGKPYEAYPPDSSFEGAYITPCQQQSTDANHNKKWYYKCDACTFNNELYWCTGHVFVGGVERRTFKRRLRHEE
jgi:hypothetical protein